MLNIKYRPTKFSELIGNETVIKKLLEQYPNWPKSFLFVGEPGTGKTTLARVIANQLECKISNIHEIDAGQDRGIDNMRKIIQSAVSRPLVGKSKVYIFDECQGLTKEAQQSLLKITEDTPSDTYFIFCSTDPAKIIKALKERCQRGYINLQPMTNKELGTLIKRVCEGEGIELTDTKREIAKLCILNAEGVPRKALMLFDKLNHYEDIESVTKELENVDTFIPEEFWAFPNALSSDMNKFIKLFSEKKDKNFETFRITMGNIFKKRLLKAMLGNNISEVQKYSRILSMFTDPVDQHIGDTQLIQRFAKYKIEQK